MQLLRWVGLYSSHRSTRTSRHPTTTRIEINQQRFTLRPRPRLSPSWTARPSRGALYRRSSSNNSNSSRNRNRNRNRNRCGGQKAQHGFLGVCAWGLGYGRYALTRTRRARRSELCRASCLVLFHHQCSGQKSDRSKRLFSWFWQQAVNNLAVALLGQGKLKEGIQVLETAFESSPSTLAMAEPFLFNLCAYYLFISPHLTHSLAPPTSISHNDLTTVTHYAPHTIATLYELRSSIAADKKRDLLIEVAKWCGDGLRTTCLKMPT